MMIGYRDIGELCSRMLTSTKESLGLRFFNPSEDTYKFIAYDNELMA